MNINFLASVFGRFYTKVRILFTHHCKNDFCGMDLQSNGHLRARGKCRKHEPQASVFYIYRVFSNVRFFYVLYSDKT